MLHLTLHIATVQYGFLQPDMLETRSCIQKLGSLGRCLSIMCLERSKPVKFWRQPQQVILAVFWKKAVGTKCCGRRLLAASVNGSYLEEGCWAFFLTSANQKHDEGICVELCCVLTRPALQQRRLIHGGHGDEGLQEHKQSRRAAGCASTWSMLSLQLLSFNSLHGWRAHTRLPWLDPECQLQRDSSHAVLSELACWIMPRRHDCCIPKLICCAKLAPAL